ncbi:MAG: hypothetical protein SNJ62_08480 [Chloracidobacterium sp.]|uniref:DUF3014 domain-containing protein n=1 Tax=Chloracidobacterium validum TaxID=2821543 RepID=A0ABX8BF79_9BACT|nr:hypothetical protein [Chloracidobacterium validum]QUW04570.1 hypothetical protein J8C06_12365 [Chloracidobacterium validum]
MTCDWQCAQLLVYRWTRLGLALLAILFLVTNDAAVAQRRKPPRRPAPQPVSPMVGKDVRIMRTDGLEIVGKLVKLDLQGVTYLNAGGEQATIALKSISVLTFGEPIKRIDKRFVNDARQALDALGRVNTLVNGNPTFSQYDALVIDARVAVEAFLSKYDDYDDQSDFFDDVRGVLRSYELVRPLWATMQGADRRISLAESAPELAPILRMYPNLRATEYNQNGRYPTDKVIAYVWNRTAQRLRGVRAQLDQLASKAG